MTEPAAGDHFCRSHPWVLVTPTKPCPHHHEEETHRR